MLLYDVLRKTNKGFTLVEMIAAVVIVGIIAALATPSLLGMLYRSRVRDGVGQVEAAIRQAQRLAIRGSQACTITFSTNAAGYSTVKAAAGSNDCLVENRVLPDDVFFSLLNGSSLDLIDSSNEIQLIFSSKGHPNVQGIMVVSHAQNPTQKCIQIEGLLGSILTGNYDSTTQECDAQ